jgi:LasA protease
MKHSLFRIAWLVCLCLAACQPQGLQLEQQLPAYKPQPATATAPVSSAGQPVSVNREGLADAQPTPYPTRPPYQPGELVDYIAQDGDTLPYLAVRFNTSVEEIRKANPIIPEDATTMPPGMPMKIPIYYAPFWGSPYKILPDSLFVDGPAQVSFDTNAFVAQFPGWLKNYTGYTADGTHSGAELVDIVAGNFSVSPRLLLALLEYQASALTQPEIPAGLNPYMLGYADSLHQGLNLQLTWAANALNNAYYAYRAGNLETITHQDGTLERPDPWQNAASVALQEYFVNLLPSADYLRAIGPDGFARTYRELFGDPWAADQPHIPGSLVQPELKLPFEPGTTWALTGGPHTGWGTGEPLAALDFAPPSVVGGCHATDEWVTAVAAGKVVRSETGLVEIDLDGDGDDRTGWVIYHLHIGTEGRVQLGTELQVGDHIGHPSCEGGRSTGTHVHIARKYNGEWIEAGGVLAFNLEGWVAFNGAEAYLGGLQRGSDTVTACVCSNASSFITAGSR